MSAPEKAAFLFQEEGSVAFGNGFEVPVFIDLDRMDLDLAVLPLEVEDLDVLRLDVPAVPDVHADSIDQIVAVSFDDESLACGRRYSCEEASEFRLSFWMKVDFGL